MPAPKSQLVACHFAQRNRRHLLFVERDTSSLARALAPIDQANKHIQDKHTRIVKQQPWRRS